MDRNIFSTKLFEMIFPEDSTTIFMVMTYHPTDLRKLFNGSGVPFNDSHVLKVFYNLLCSLNFLHTANVIHRDIKPANLLIDSECNVYICDFGMSRTMSEKRSMSPHMVSRWYRAPEVIICCKDYGMKIDLWAMGCVLGELMRFSE
jgi:serine/threonine protein kinase